MRIPTAIRMRGQNLPNQSKWNQPNWFSRKITPKAIRIKAPTGTREGPSYSGRTCDASTGNSGPAGVAGEAAAGTGAVEGGLPPPNRLTLLKPNGSGG